MIEIEARVVAVEAGYAWVEAERRSGCSHCSSSTSCGVASLGKAFGVRQQRLCLPDTLGVRTGENIVIGLSEQRLVAAAAMAYMLPLFLMIGTALVSAALGYGQGALALSSLVGLAGGLWLVQHRFGSRRAIARYQPVILERPQLSEHTLEFKTPNTGANHE